MEKGALLFELDTENLETMAETARLQYEAAVSGSNTTIIQTKSAWDSAGDMYATLKDSRDAIEDARDSAKAGLEKAKKALEDAKALQDSPDLPEDQKPTADDIANLEKAVAGAEEGYNQAQNAYIQNYDKLDEQVTSARKNLVNARDTYKNTKGDEEEGITGTIQSQIDLAKISYDNTISPVSSPPKMWRSAIWSPPAPPPM